MNDPAPSSTDLRQALDAYLALLPDGIDSYPECTTKASAFVVALREKAFTPEPGLLPGPVERLISEPPLPSAWVPTVHFHCLMTTLRHQHFPGPGGETPFLRFMKDKDREMFRTPMYRAMFFLISPKRLLLGLSSRWRQFNRGTELDCVESGDRRAVVRLEHPPYLLIDEHDRGWASSVEVAIESAGGKSPIVDPQRLSPEAVILRTSWQ